jgi:hypothetical protein
MRMWGASVNVKGLWVCCYWAWLWWLVAATAWCVCRCGVVTAGCWISSDPWQWCGCSPSSSAEIHSTHCLKNLNIFSWGLSSWESNTDNKWLTAVMKRSQLLVGWLLTPGNNNKLMCRFLLYTQSLYKLVSFLKNFPTCYTHYAHSLFWPIHKWTETDIKLALVLRTAASTHLISSPLP